MRNLFVFLLAVFSVAVAQDNTAVPFVLDASKPYVYLAFDHVGQRKPIEPGESKQGVWLKFVNNCRVPVTIGTFDPGTGDPGIGVLHEVVPIATSGFGGIPRTAETQSKTATKAPEGYSSEVYAIMTVSPGKGVLFSMPLNHLSPHWFIRVEFTLEVPKGTGNQPYGYADFFWDNLPKQVKGPKQ